MKYTLVKGFHQRFEGVEGDGKMKRALYKPGDPIDLTKAEVEKLGERVKPVVKFEDDAAAVEEVTEVQVSTLLTEEPTTEEPESETVADESAASVLDQHWQHVKAHIRQSEDLEELAALYAEESAGRARDTILQEISIRLGELDETDDDESDE